jgi:biopolymer transport protein ExbD
MASSSIKRQRKRRRMDSDGDPEFQVAPMVDVLLVLMLFFMAITSTEVLKKDPKLELASAKNAKKDEQGHRKHEIVVNVHWDDANSLAQFSLDGVNYATADSMQGVLAAQHQQDPAAYVVIRADKSTEYSNISDLMAACASAGISTVTFSVLIGGDNNKQAPAAPGGTASN